MWHRTRVPMRMGERSLLNERGVTYSRKRHYEVLGAHRRATGLKKTKKTATLKDRERKCDIENSQINGVCTHWWCATRNVMTWRVEFLISFEWKFKRLQQSIRQRRTCEATWSWKKRNIIVLTAGFHPQSIHKDWFHVIEVCRSEFEFQDLLNSRWNPRVGRQECVGAYSWYGKSERSEITGETWRVTRYRARARIYTERMVEVDHEENWMRGPLFWVGH